MSYRFEVNHHGSDDRLRLAAMLEAFANDQWHAAHMDAEQAAAAMLDRFARLVRQELELIEVVAAPTDSAFPNSGPDASGGHADRC
jgi:hypothetical protein